MASPFRGSTFRLANEIADPPQGFTYRRPLLLDAEQNKAFRADERVGHQRPDFLGREGAEPPKLALGSARHLDDEIEPAQEAGPDDLGHLSVDPTRGDQLLQNTHVTGGDVVVEVVT